MPTSQMQATLNSAPDPPRYGLTFPHLIPNLQRRLGCAISIAKTNIRKRASRLLAHKKPQRSISKR